MSSEIQQVTIDHMPINPLPLMSSPLEALPQVSHSTDNSNLSPQVTKHSKQIDVHAPILNTTPTVALPKLERALIIT